MRVEHILNKIGYDPDRFVPVSKEVVLKISNQAKYTHLVMRVLLSEPNWIKVSQNQRKTLNLIHNGCPVPKTLGRLK